jgi:hypothetical protein
MEAYTASSWIYVPDVEIHELKANQTTVALRGYRFILAVLNVDGFCIGWIVKE